MKRAMASRTYITAEGYEAESMRFDHTRESIAEAIAFSADLYCRTGNPAAAAELSMRQALAVERYGYTWEEVEAIEVAAYEAVA